MEAKTIAVIGGGASGLAAAVAAGRFSKQLSRKLSSRPDRSERLGSSGNLNIVVYEADHRVGKSILRSGNGRCNYSNAVLRDCRALELEEIYRNPLFVNQSLFAQSRRYFKMRGLKGLRSWEEDAVTEYLADLGLYFHEDSEGRRYPITGKASTVLDILRSAAVCYGVQEECESQVLRIEAARREKEAPGEEKPAFHLRFSDGRIAHADAVVLAVGGRGLSTVELPSGLEALPLSPVLGSLRTRERWPQSLDGCRVRCSLSLRNAGDEEIAAEKGEVQFRPYGVSGIAVFNLSRFAKAGDHLVLNLLDARACDIEHLLYARRKRLGRSGLPVSAETLLQGLLLPRLAQVVLKEAGISSGQAAQEDAKLCIPALARILTALPLTVEGIAEPDRCQVMRGGLEVDGFTPESMMSRDICGFFACGEALDIDAACGGFNLHWAWASGILAGESAAELLLGVSYEDIFAAADCRSGE